MIASETPLTYRQVVWCLNRIELEDRRRGALNHWIETAPIDEVGGWVWEQWLQQDDEDRKSCDTYN